MIYINLDKKTIMGTGRAGDIKKYGLFEACMKDK
jgi:hypothetical protein